jgi:hypothetical protein
MSSRKTRALEKRALAVLYDNFTSLDFYGPWAIFQNAFRDPEYVGPLSLTSDYF